VCAACTRRGISCKLGGALPIVETFLATRLHLSRPRFVRNLITRPRAFSYYHSTEFRVTVSNSLGRTLNAALAPRFGTAIRKERGHFYNVNNEHPHEGLSIIENLD